MRYKYTGGQTRRVLFAARHAIRISGVPSYTRFPTFNDAAKTWMTCARASCTRRLYVDVYLTREGCLIFL